MWSTPIKPFRTSLRPDHAFETYIAELARLYRQSNLDSRQIRAAAEIMQKSIDFISLAVPSTAAEKARFMDALADAREKVLHDAEAESFHKKAG